ncbi:hypothetical protein [Microtetraspora malaysiensis]|uniref:Uncharacterized protein n=1 Tax=Microtetraspora malaysiensis TaxID=161358 RepID=A0ABW6SQD9_9ACTN
MVTSDRLTWRLTDSAYTAQNMIPVLWIDSGEDDSLGKALARKPYPSAALHVTPTTPFEYLLARAALQHPRLAQLRRAQGQDRVLQRARPGRAVAA